MTDFSLDAVPFLLAFIVPGFVWAKVHNAWQVSRPGAGDSWLGIFTLSGVNYALWFWAIPTLIANTASALSGRSHPTVATASGWLLVTLISRPLKNPLPGATGEEGATNSLA